MSKDEELKKQVRDIIGFDDPETVKSLSTVALSLPAHRFEEITEKLVCKLVEARYNELADLNYWIAMNDISKDCTPKLFVHLSERLAQLQGLGEAGK